MDARTRVDLNVAACVEVDVDERRRGVVRVRLTRHPFDLRDDLASAFLVHSFAIEPHPSDYGPTLERARRRAHDADVVLHPRRPLWSPARAIDEGVRSGHGVVHAVFKDERTCLLGSTTWPDAHGMWVTVTGPSRPEPQALYASAVLGFLQWRRRSDPEADRSLLRTPLPERIDLYEEGKKTRLRLDSMQYPLPPVRPRTKRFGG